MRREDFAYCALYCEENIWKLTQSLNLRRGDGEVWLICNPTRTVATWAQRACRDAHTPVIWDYHVVLALAPKPRPGEPSPWRVMDFDHRGPFVQAAVSWLRASFPARLPQTFAPRFHRIDAWAFRQRFASDRQHMRDPDDPKSWRAPPPPWPLIGAADAVGFGTWLDEAETRRRPPLDPEPIGIWSDLDTLRLEMAKATSSKSGDLSSG